MKKVGIISQARMTSTRLPGKVLLPAADKPMLEHHVARLSVAGSPLYLAITDRTEDDALEQFAIEEDLPYFRGDEDDVLSRFFHLADRESLDVIVRVTSDCPLIDGALVREGIERYLELDDPTVYLSNCQERTYPVGMDFEIISSQMLAEAFNNADQSHEREHVMPYFYQGRSGSRLVHLKQEQDQSEQRLTLDTEADYKLLTTLIEDHDAIQLTHQELSALLIAHPELVAINAAIKQKTIPSS